VFGIHGKLSFTVKKEKHCRYVGIKCNFLSLYKRLKSSCGENPVFNVVYQLAKQLQSFFNT